jgi:hypothetical protein
LKLCALVFQSLPAGGEVYLMLWKMEPVRFYVIPGTLQAAGKLFFNWLRIPVCVKGWHE